MKILFVQNVWLEFLGVMSLSSVLKENDHECDLIIENNPKKIVKYINKTNPDIIGFSCNTGMHKWVVKVSREIKKHFSISIILGGPHPTFFPEVINEPFIDIICRGEGEYALLDLMNKMSRGEDIKKIKNLWVKIGKKIYRNELRPLINNLDDLPFPDRKLYYKYSFLRKNPMKFFMIGRGCPFECTFCFNHKMKELYRCKGQYVRKRSVGNVINEIKNVKEKFGVSFIYFTDDTFNLDFRWLKKFLKKYKKEVGIPYFCQIRVDLISESLVKNLKSSGCFGVEIGVETGNEFLRKNILRKNVTNEQFITSAKLFKKYGIIIRTTNILGIPGETLSTVFETIDLIRKMKTDIPWCSIFMPYPKLELTDYSINKNLLKRKFDFDDIGFSIHKKSPLTYKDKRQIENLHKFFYFLIKIPSLTPLIKILVRLPLDKLYYLIYILTYIHMAKKAFHYNLRYLLQLGLRLFPSKLLG